MGKKLRNMTKMNNKGNTLAIVIIGIFILSILGTLILGTTSTNYQMKANDKKSEMVFYYSEQAMDELYAGIGKEVMDKVTDSYTYALESYVSEKPGNVSGEDTAQYLFARTLRKKLTDVFEDGTLVNTDPTTGVADRLMALLDSYISSATGYTSSVYLANGDLTVTYYKKETTAGNTVLTELESGDTIYDVDAIKIKDVGVKCESDTGFVSSLVTDFDINIPELSLDFHDSATGGDLSDLARCALVCEGSFLNYQGATTTDSPIIIGAGSSVKISGNVYANGDVYTRASATSTANGNAYYTRGSSLVRHNPSVTIQDNADLDINSKLFYCENDFSINAGDNVTIGNLTGTDSTNAEDSLQFFARDIETVAGTAGASFYFLGGNCFVKDDFEINGGDSSVYISGNYFGYGLRDTTTMGIHNGIEADTASTNAIGAVGGGITDENEDKDSSAFIVNGKGADVYMTGASVTLPDGTAKTMPALQKLVLLGRAYIDLDPLGTTHSYMTGESVSFRGNQNVYLASTSRADQLGGSGVESNPMRQSDLTGKYGVSSLSSLTYSMIGVDDTKIVAKRVADSGSSTEGDIYFYLRNTNPVVQTNYFRNVITVGSADYDADKRNEVIKQLGADGIDVKGFRVLSRTTGLDYYSSGAIMNVTRRGTTADLSLSTINYTSGMSSLSNPANMVNFVDIINNRAMNAKYKLKDLTAGDATAAGLFSSFADIGSATEETLGTVSTDCPYDYYINRDKLMDKIGDGSLRYTFTFATDTDNKEIYGLADIPATDAAAKTLNDKLKSILTNAGINYNSSTVAVGVFLNNESTNYGTTVNMNAGVVISERPCSVQYPFTGVIMNNHCTYLFDHAELTADEELTLFMFENVAALKEILNDDFSGTSGPTTGDVVSDNSMKYTDLVKKSNWRKENN